MRAPLRATRAQIDAFVASKADWIREHQARLQAQPRAPQRQFISGEHLPYLGQNLPLEVTPTRLGVELRNGRILLDPKLQATAEAACTVWYKRQARQVLAERVSLHAARLGLKPSSLRISSARTRWGSCSSRGTISFTWRLVMAPLEVVDYVVVHELVHLQIHNHSRDFWQRVYAAYPPSEQARRWLKINGQTLNL